MSINAVFAHFLAGSDLKLHIHSSFFTDFAVIFPDYGASAHFRGSSCSKLCINAVFAHFLCRSALNLRIRSSFLQTLIALAGSFPPLV
jgi:hypothetical protein